MPLTHIALALVVAVVWGYNYVAIKVGLHTYPPFLFSALRFAAASLPFLPFIGGPRVAWRWVFALGTVLGVVYFAFFFLGMAMGIPAGLTSALIQTQIFFTMAFGAVLLGERPQAKSLIGCVVAFVGVGLIAGRMQGANMLGFLLILASAACWGYANILTRQAHAPDAMRLMVWVSAVATLPLLGLSWIFEGQDRILAALAASDWNSLGTIVYVGWGATIVGFGLWSYLLKRHPAATVAPYSLLVPVFGLASSMLFLGERMDLMQLAGTALIVLSIVTNSWPSGRQAQRRGALST